MLASSSSPVFAGSVGDRIRVGVIGDRSGRLEVCCIEYVSTCSKSHALWLKIWVKI